MLKHHECNAKTDAEHRIRPHDATPPVEIPAGYVGPFVFPGTGRMVWWTGRVAIGLLHQPQPRCEAVNEATLWAQDLLTRRAPRSMAA
ncbi:MAG TPA: hypothetical protein VGP22_04350 [Albitalea sp.]|jgi:hypothetical protein|nr:hypothetical protein [Albitalea sp.]